jgi:hypothetical protein
MFHRTLASTHDKIAKPVATDTPIHFRRPGTSKMAPIHRGQPTSSAMPQMAIQITDA